MYSLDCWRRKYWQLKRGFVCIRNCEDVTAAFLSPLLCNVVRSVLSVLAPTKYCQSTLHRRGRGVEFKWRFPATSYQIVLKLVFTGNNSSVHSTVLLGLDEENQLHSPYSPYKKTTVPTAVPITSLRSLQKINQN